jgi:hypothetical protein
MRVHLIALGRWAGRQWSSIVLLATGEALLVTAFYQREGRDDVAIAALFVATLLVLAGALHHRGFRGKVGASGGVEFDVPADQQARQNTATLAESESWGRHGAIPPDQADDVARWFIASRFLSDHVRTPGPPLEDCTFQLFLYDADEDALFPLLDPGHDGPVPFAVGQGAVGRAWSEERYVVAEGIAVSDATFGLSPEQQERYRDLAVVTAVPVTNAAGRPLAVLSASSRNPRSKLTQTEGFRHHVFLADLVARVLVDLLKWFDDRYDATTEEA